MEDFLQLCHTEGWNSKTKSAATAALADNGDQTTANKVTSISIVVSQPGC
jgi:hypothetical protein